MKLDKEYTGQITKALYVKKAIKGVEDKKEYKRVGNIQVEIPFQDGDLDSFVNPSCVCNDERVGEYELDINDTISTVRVIKIGRKNKSEVEGTFSIMFETEDMDNVSIIGNYLKDKDTPANIKLTAKE
jgi:hypothetical protein